MTTMTQRAFIAGTLAGILSGIAYLSTPSIAKQPPLQPSPTSSTYSSEGTIKLQEKMREICERSFYYRGYVGRIEDPEPGPFMNFNYDPSIIRNSSKEYSNAGRSSVRLEDMITCYPFNSVPLLFVLSAESVETINADGKFMRYNESVYSNPTNFLTAVIRAYEGIQKRCQEGVLGLTTTVMVKQGVTSIINTKTRVNIPNQMYDKASVAARILLTGSSQTKRKVIKIGEQHFLDGKPSRNETFILSVDDLDLVVMDARGFQW